MTNDECKALIENLCARIGRGIVAVQSGESESTVVAMLRGEAHYDHNTAVFEQAHTPTAHPAHSGHKYGGGYARAAALAAGDPDWMNATGGTPTDDELKALLADAAAYTDGYTEEDASGPIKIIIRLVTALRHPVQAEEAHTPTDDEREALEDVLREEFEYRIRTAVAYGSMKSYREIPVQVRADWIQGEISKAMSVARTRVLDSFRRPVQGEPTDWSRYIENPVTGEVSLAPEFRAQAEPTEVRDPRPTDEAWDRTLDDYREAGWVGDEPADWERMFWEAGFRKGVATLRAAFQEGGNRG